MRGILAGAADGLEHQRFIPADAGNTHGVFPLHQLFSVHPRGCGEYYSTAILILISTGSSPRMRGIRRSWRGRRWPCRFIPADAGNTERPALFSASVAVHPRGCGEYVRKALPRVACLGSSPRMRGILHRSAAPTCHGAVHPRGCGEYRRRCCESWPITGSSPRMRGIHTRWPCGNTATAVHPRGCGEYVARMNGLDGMSGSSPRMRGIRNQHL